ncbi:hypothetical protein [Streptococcus marimammalium]|uniref:hypothetical protein n=1 Tax=Streptococcus marimammalium TaxID=269666 RepID=UPI00035CFCBF|nr:hypothetical protein [Streptococcus marimammalium]
MGMLEAVSLRILFEETFEVQQIIYQIINSQDFNHYELYTGLIPFLSSIVDGLIEKLKLKKIEFTNIGSVPFDKFVKYTRVSIKLYSDKMPNKANKKLKKEGYERLRILKTDYNFFQKSYVKSFG